MGLIIISLVIGGIGYMIVRRNIFRTGPTIIASLLIVFAMLGFLAGLFVPTGEYSPMEEIKSTPLQDLISNEISIDEECSNYAVLVVEEEECDNPRVVEYKQYVKPTFWSFGWGKIKETIIFYIPKNSLIN